MTGAECVGNPIKFQIDMRAAEKDLAVLSQSQKFESPTFH